MFVLEFFGDVEMVRENIDKALPSPWWHDAGDASVFGMWWQSSLGTSLGVGVSQRHHSDN